MKNESSSYLYHLIPKPSTLYSTRNSKIVPLRLITASLKTLLFSFTITEWNKIYSNIRSSPSYKLFRKRILEFIRPHPNSIFNVPNSLGLTYLTRLRHVSSHLRKHKFCHNFWIYQIQFATAAVLLNQLSTTFSSA